MKNSPKLRFPEFVNDGEWEEKTLGKCLLKHPDYGVNAAAVPFSENLPTYLRITDISVDGYYLNNEKVSVNIDATSDNYLEDGDIVLARTGASVGKSYKYRKEDGALVFAGFLIRVKPDEKKLNSDLLFHFLSTEKYWNWVSVTSARSGQPGINGNEYANLPIPIPSTLNEQQKIADCLSSVDSLISAQSQKVELLKEHKKALMQQLFPQDGEEAPKLRFPEFKNTPKWEEKKLGDLLDYEQPTNYLVSDTNYNDSFEIPVLTAGKTFILGYTNETHGIFQNPLPVIIFDDFTTATQFVNFPFKAKSSAMKILKPKDDFGNIKIIFELIQTIEYQANEHKRYWISEYQNLEIKLPSPKEQQKIANCLSSLDEQISQQTTKLQTLKEHKKALMQQLFPSKGVKI